MKTLELKQMENFEGVTISECAGAVMGVMGLIVGVATAAGPLGWGVLAFGAVGYALSVSGGDPCEEYAG